MISFVIIIQKKFWPVHRLPNLLEKTVRQICIYNFFHVNVLFCDDLFLQAIKFLAKCKIHCTSTLLINLQLRDHNNYVLPTTPCQWSCILMEFRLLENDKNQLLNNYLIFLTGNNKNNWARANQCHKQKCCLIQKKQNGHSMIKLSYGFLFFHQQHHIS